jgi:uncharacterized membrane protein YkoI
MYRSWEIRMKTYKILTAAASIIALTATVSFARDLKDTKDDDYCRIKVEARASTKNADDISANSLPIAIDSETGNIYQVEIEGGNKVRMVSIDAYTGIILGNTEVPSRKS